MKNRLHLIQYGGMDWEKCKNRFQIQGPRKIFKKIKAWTSVKLITSTNKVLPIIVRKPTMLSCEGCPELSMLRGYFDTEHFNIVFRPEPIEQHIPNKDDDVAKVKLLKRSAECGNSEWQQQDTQKSSDGADKRAWNSMQPSWGKRKIESGNHDNICTTISWNPWMVTYRKMVYTTSETAIFLEYDVQTSGRSRT
ncbi:unnamed protein product [Nesidiocoris tenuis]|uniref:Uncharacterized protein n=1 Tax=Nesidiocoris tenuis TaxID=355587 RepID=A0A6H5GSH8_9HEMI|nr:unnamed protein product [Nesidiocoris tenuis]